MISLDYYSLKRKFDEEVFSEEATRVDPSTSKEQVKTVKQFVVY